MGPLRSGIWEMITVSVEPGACFWAAGLCANTGTGKATSERASTAMPAYGRARGEDLRAWITSEPRFVAPGHIGNLAFRGKVCNPKLRPRLHKLADEYRGAGRDALWSAASRLQAHGERRMHEVVGRVGCEPRGGGRFCE